MTQVTAQMMTDAISNVLAPEYLDTFNYEAAAEEASDNAADYGIAEFELAGRLTISGNPFVARF